MRTNSAKTFSKTFTSLLLLLVLFVALYFVTTFTNNFTTGIKMFYVKYGSTEIKQDTKLELENNKYIFFFCNYVLGLPSDTTTDKYSVKVLSQADDKTTFDYHADGRTYSYITGTDMTDSFNIRAYKDYFTIYLDANTTMSTLLSSHHSDKPITNIPSLDLSATAYFTLVISSYNGSESININFTIKGDTTL